MPIPTELLDKILLESYETGMKQISEGAIDLILTDPPYGITDCPWDVRPDLNFMWKEFLRVLKPNGAVVVTATQPFATDLINSNRKYFRYDLIWVKSNPVGFLNSHKMPMRQHELVLVFYRRLPAYNPQMMPGACRVSRQLQEENERSKGVYRKTKKVSYEHEGRYPTSILPFNKEGGGPGRHPTQKPVALFRYLVRMYSNPGELVFDPFMGSGTTAVSAVMENRHFFGFEREGIYHKHANERLQSINLMKITGESSTQ
jgi:site-specific DNA-methyltransferase (adenine-specific)